jgi:hypothetical protein
MPADQATRVGHYTAMECIEVYVPKKLEHLSELYTYLRNKLSKRKEGRRQRVPIDGFSLYEVDGAFYGEQIYQERTIVIRILLNRANDDDETIHDKIQLLGTEIASTVAISEEELWICHYSQNMTRFRLRAEPKTKRP